MPITRLLVAPVCSLISPKEMAAVLHSMNNTVSYFGDDKLSDDRIEKMVKEVGACCCVLAVHTAAVGYDTLAASDLRDS